MTTGAEKGEIAEVGSPVVIEGDPVAHRHPLRWASVTIGTAALLLALTNAQAIAGWFDELTPSATTERLREPVEGWSALTAAVGLDAPRTWLRGRWKAAQAARFGKEKPGEQGADDAP
ncbi:hypothetical protein [Flavisphingomonas formosensis]|uniref:hypothetical protein n=1 Tax=Flavisphingomonas formosensis TaxID=861534 RepID=UPI0012F95525|nr:hypothetical protein [Sphingomonas formosensis]